MTKKWLSILSLLLLSALMTGCAVSNANVEIKGSALYRERIKLPEHAVLTVKVLDITSQTPSGERLAEITRAHFDIPASFDFFIQRDQFEVGHEYGVEANISLNGELIFSSTQTYPIDINSNEPMTILLQKIQ